MDNVNKIYYILNIRKKIFISYFKLCGIPPYDINKHSIKNLQSFIENLNKYLYLINQYISINSINTDNMTLKEKGILSLLSIKLSTTKECLTNFITQFNSVQDNLDEKWFHIYKELPNIGIHLEKTFSYEDNMFQLYQKYIILDNTNLKKKLF